MTGMFCVDKTYIEFYRCLWTSRPHTCWSGFHLLLLPAVGASHSQPACQLTSSNHYSTTSSSEQQHGGVDISCISYRLWRCTWEQWIAPRDNAAAAVTAVAVPNITWSWSYSLSYLVLVAAAASPCSEQGLLEEQQQQAAPDVDHLQQQQSV